jgi:hypothetical protein
MLVAEYTWWVDFLCLGVIMLCVAMVRYIIKSSKIEGETHYIASDPGDECEHIYKSYDRD